MFPAVLVLGVFGAETRFSALQKSTIQRSRKEQISALQLQLRIVSDQRQL